MRSLQHAGPCFSKRSRVRPVVDPMTTGQGCTVRQDRLRHIVFMNTTPGSRSTTRAIRCNACKSFVKLNAAQIARLDVVKNTVRRNMRTASRGSEYAKPRTRALPGTHARDTICTTRPCLVAARPDVQCSLSTILSLPVSSSRKH